MSFENHYYDPPTPRDDDPRERFFNMRIEHAIIRYHEPEGGVWLMNHAAWVNSDKNAIVVVDDDPDTCLLADCAIERDTSLPRGTFVVTPKPRNYIPEDWSGHEQALQGDHQR